jgi:hypothetical protein
MARSGRPVPPPRYPFPRWNALKWRLNPLKRLQYRAYTSRGTAPVWGYVLLAFAVGRALKRLNGPERLAIDRLKPGDQIVVRTIPMGSRAERKAARSS